MKARRAELIRDGIQLARSIQPTGLVYDQMLRSPRTTRKAFHIAAARDWARNNRNRHERDSRA